MNAFVTCADSFREAFPGVAVLVVHHTGKESIGGSADTPRYRAAADTILRLSKRPSVLTLKCDKQKDAEPFKELSLKLRKVRLQNGTSSCVIERASATINKDPADIQAPKLASDRTSSRSH